VSVPLKRRLRYDDSLDVFGVHGVGGVVGTLLLAPFASTALGGRVPDLVIGTQFKAQLIGTVGSALYSVVCSYALLKLIKATIGLRVTEQQEREGLDQSEHAEVGYEL
jgi:Amt family ammonium transporter